MQRYVEQLIEDLEELATTPPTPVYIETPPHMEEIPFAAELALVPYKTLAEWTNFDPIKFPNIFKLSDEQIEKINSAIFKVLENYQIELVDVPDDIPPEWLYDILVDGWGTAYVQYLPSSGFDWELCTGDPTTCPYGEYCKDCGEEFDDEEEEDRGEPPVEGEDDIDLIIPF